MSTGAMRRLFGSAAKKPGERRGKCAGTRQDRGRIQPAAHDAAVADVGGLGEAGAGGAQHLVERIEREGAGLVSASLVEVVVRLWFSPAISRLVTASVTPSAMTMATSSSTIVMPRWRFGLPGVMAGSRASSVCWRRYGLCMVVARAGGLQVMVMSTDLAVTAAKRQRPIGQAGRGRVTDVDLPDVVVECGQLRVADNVHGAGGPHGAGNIAGEQRRAVAVLGIDREIDRARLERDQPEHAEREDQDRDQRLDQRDATP
jgi:hypothetical protein